MSGGPLPVQGAAREAPSLHGEAIGAPAVGGKYRRSLRGKLQPLRAGGPTQPRPECRDHGTPTAKARAVRQVLGPSVLQAKCATTDAILQALGTSGPPQVRTATQQSSVVGGSYP